MKIEKKSNLDTLKNHIEKLGYKIGCIDVSLNNLTQKAIKEIINNLGEEYTDVFITMKKELYVIEISTVDQEKDIILYTAYKYFSKYGNLYDAYECEYITEEQYNKLCDMGLE